MDFVLAKLAISYRKLNIASIDHIYSWRKLINDIRNVYQSVVNIHNQTRGFTKGVSND
jgi:hypothetical protein